MKRNSQQNGADITNSSRVLFGDQAVVHSSITAALCFEAEGRSGTQQGRMSSLCCVLLIYVWRDEVL